jgi:medium-chain acyl-[acyl-carrier-protein] hydrolase
MVKGVTWAHNLSKIQTARDFLLYDEAGDLFAKGTSAWLVLDEHNTHVLRMTDEIMAPYGREEDHPAFPGYAFPKEAPAFEVERRAELTVSKAMIDCNDHVHNTAYMDLFNEALPEDEDMDRFHDVTLVYRREIRPGQRIKAAFGRAGEERVVVLSEEETDQVHAFLLLR